MLRTRVALASLLFVLSACGGKKEQPAPPPTAVSYVTVAEQAVALSSELPGRTAPFETSDVRPQVNGLIRERLFTEGDIVHAGQALYRIDPAPYLAAAASARATLAKARASIASSAALARRYGELVKINAIARQEYENSQATAAANRADVAAAQAALQSAQIDLSRTTIRAPISGRIGRSLATTGALVTAAQADPLTTIQRLDPIYVDIQQSSADLLRLREQFLKGQVARAGTTQVRIKLETGTLYGQTGTLRFADVTVNPTTGSQTIRAIVPNGSGLLLPGMFVRAVLPEGTQTRALLVPQRAVSRDEKGNATVMIVGKDNKAEPRMIQTSRAQGDNWIVTSGLKPGDKVIVEGGMMLRPGGAVNPSPFGSKPAPAQAPAAKAE
jgi:membrane fusion protein, multidrug efflux system